MAKSKIMAPNASQTASAASASRFTSSINITFKSAEQAQDAKDSLLQETEFKKRCRAKVSAKGSTLEISLDADDLPVLRAALNSYIRLLYIFEGIDSVEAEDE